MAKRIGVVLAGCGVYDGSEIHETVLTMLALQKKGYELEFFAPDIDQAHVVNHQEGAPAEGESRRVLIEAARLARQPVTDIRRADAGALDGLFLPGGFGVAKNLCNFAFEGEKMEVREDVAKLVQDCFNSNKPMAFVCIAPVIAARVIGNHVEITLGEDPGVAAKVEAMGARHIAKPVDQAHVDNTMKIVTAPAYMSAKNLLEVEASINAAVDAFAKLVG